MKILKSTCRNCGAEFEYQKVSKDRVICNACRTKVKPENVERKFKIVKMKNGVEVRDDILGQVMITPDNIYYKRSLEANHSIKNARPRKAGNI